MFAQACVATAPTPAFAHGTTLPTPRNRLCTATPRSPVFGSYATIEKVATHPRQGSGGGSGGTEAHAATSTSRLTAFMPAGYAIPPPRPLPFLRAAVGRK